MERAPHRLLLRAHEASRAEDGFDVGPRRIGSVRSVLSHEDAGAHLHLLRAVRLEPGFAGGQMLARRHPDPVNGYRTRVYFVKDGQDIPGIGSALSGKRASE